MISSDGLVLTNSHVVDGARELRLTDPEGRSMEARLIGEDPDSDLALLRADAARNLPAATLGDSKKLRSRCTCLREAEAASLRRRQAASGTRSLNPWP